MEQVLQQKRLAESTRGVEMGPGKRAYRSEAMEFFVASARVTLERSMVCVCPAPAERGGVFASGVCCGIVLPQCSSSIPFRSIDKRFFSFFFCAAVRVRESRAHLRGDRIFQLAFVARDP